MEGKQRLEPQVATCLTGDEALLTMRVRRAAKLLLFLAVLRFPAPEGLLGAAGACAVLCLSQAAGTRDVAHRSRLMGVISLAAALASVVLLVGTVVVAAKLIPYSGSKAMATCMERAEREALNRHPHASHQRHDHHYAIGGQRFDVLMMLHLEEDPVMDLAEMDNLVRFANEPPIGDMVQLSSFPRAGRALNQMSTDVIGSAVALSDRVMPLTTGEPPRQRCMRVGKAVRIIGAVCLLLFMALEISLALAAINAYKASQELVRFARTAGPNTI